MNTLRRVITMVKDGLFVPDATRANFFPNFSFRAAGTPAHVVMQPFTPAFAKGTQPTTPQKVSGVGPSSAGAGVDDTSADTGDCTMEVEDEPGWNLVDNSGVDCVIDVSSDSDVDSSESDSFDSSGDDDEFQVDEATDEPLLEQQRQPLCRDDLALMVRNSRTKVIHECCPDSRYAISGQGSFLAVMKGKLTNCGRVIGDHFSLVQDPVEWPEKCRVCFRGRRDPRSCGSLG